MKALFICNQNKNRSKTAEEIFRDSFVTRSAGLYTRKPVTAKELSWADIIFVMEEEQRHELARRFPKEYIQKRILSLDIPDTFGYNDPLLRKALFQKMKRYKSLLA